MEEKINSDHNPLYPIFLKMNTFNTLIVGGGNVALEKLTFLFKSSPNANVIVVAPTILDEIKRMSQTYSSLQLKIAPFSEEMLTGIQLLILSTENHTLNLAIKQKAKIRGILTNVADTPDECDFYMGSIVTKGDLKLAISTNGKSPTLAKRFRQMMEETLPDETNSLIENLTKIRDELKGTFSEKVKSLNELTESLLKNKI